MIGILSGKVLFSDGQEVIILTGMGIGYQAHCYYILPEGERTSLYVSHIIRENSEALYCFKNLREKKLFELLITVKGVGPRSAFNVVSKIGTEEIISSIRLDQKKILTQVSGIGTKAASQMVLDLQKKIEKLKMYSQKPLKTIKTLIDPIPESELEDGNKASGVQEEGELDFAQNLLEDTVLACQNLGFQSEHIIPLAQKILRENQIKKTEQLVHLVLKGI